MSQNPFRTGWDRKQGILPTLVGIELSKKLTEKQWNLLLTESNFYFNLFKIHLQLFFIFYFKNCKTTRFTYGHEVIPLSLVQLNSNISQVGIVWHKNIQVTKREQNVQGRYQDFTKGYMSTQCAPCSWNFLYIVLQNKQLLSEPFTASFGALRHQNQQINN